MEEPNYTYIQEKETGWEAFASLFSARHCDDELISAEFDSFRYHGNDLRSLPALTDTIIHILVLSGWTEVRIDGVLHRCSSTQNNIIAIKPMDELQGMRISADFKGYLLGIGRNYMMQHAFRPQFIPIHHMFKTRSIPAFTLSAPELQYLFSLGQKIERNFARDTFCAGELIFLSVMEFHLELLVMIMDRLKSGTVGRAEPRKTDLCIRFSDLIFRHCRKQHEVSFYAEELCITPQYLTRIFREATGLGAKEAIDHALLSEATVLLRTDRTLQQIADELRFADQSSFGKFFKKYTGLTPARFRAKNR
ncbi:MAG: helix-turn-helix domain-containing protein [Alistipes sp.]|nr:helix-turn-helix domain-containing protein [Alistipes sp.]